MEFFQRGNTLYIIGGYGFSATAATTTSRTASSRAVDVPGAIEADQERHRTGPHFRQITDQPHGRYRWIPRLVER